MNPINDPLLCGYLHDIFDFNDSDISRFPEEIYPLIHMFLTISSAQLAALFNGGNANLKVLKKEGDGFKEYKPEEALSGADVIAIFFSGHWCPVCVLSVFLILNFRIHQLCKCSFRSKITMNPI